MIRNHTALVAGCFSVLLFLAFIIGCSDDDCPTCPEPEEEPNVIDNLSAQTNDYNSITLGWTAPNGVELYDIRYSTSMIDSSNWASAVQSETIPFPQDEGETQLFVLDGLDDYTQYYVAMKFRFDDSVWSDLSNVATCYTAPFDSRGKIVFTSYDNYIPKIWMIDADGSNLQQLSSTYSTGIASSWTYDGSGVLFGSDRDGDYDVYALDIVSGVETNLSNTSTYALFGHCAPSGGMIVFSYIDDGTYQGLMTMDIGGAGEYVLIEDNDHYESYYHPMFSYDGTKIVSDVSMEKGGVVGADGAIVTMSVSGAGWTRLTDTTAFFRDPAWSPDGTQVVCSRYQGGNSEIIIMDADGSNQVNITNNAASDIEPHWSPDGNRIVFCSDRDGDYEVCVMDPDGSNFLQLTHNTYTEGHPRWSPLY